ncbi:MAG: N-acetyltransferase family protein [Slackia sp.]
MSELVYTFRLATAADAEALQAIYAPYIETSITFECTCPSVEEFRKRIEERVWCILSSYAKKTASR